MNTKINLSFIIVLALYGSALGLWSEPVPVTEVNTDYGDRTPSLSYDGLTLYFCRVDTPDFYYHRIYQATRPEPQGPFPSVQEISSLNYSDGHVACPWVSPDNLRMYYHRTEPGSKWRLKVTERASINDPWQPGVNLDELNVLGDLGNPSLTEDGLTIVFCGNNLSGGQGGTDLWMANRPDKNSSFSNIVNLTELNTTANDVDPFIASNGLSLYFTSNIDGNYQIYKAERESLDAPFGNVEHLSFFDTPGANSRLPSLSSDGSAFYFCRELEGAVVSADIYVSYIPEPATVLLLGFGTILAIRKKR